MRVSGLSLLSYWLSVFVSDLVFSATTMIAIYIFMAIFGADIPLAWALVLLMTFANPLFLYVASSFFIHATNARNGILFLFLFTGILIPFALPIVLTINEDTYLLVKYI